MAPVGQSSPLTLTDSLDRYAKGDFDAASRYAAANRFDAAVFVKTLEDWASAGLVNSIARRRRAAAFGLEVAWALQRDGPISSRPRPGPSSALLPILAWACESMPSTSHPAERAWYLVSVSLLEHARMWPTLLGGSTVTPSPGPLQRVLQREAREGHLHHVKRRYSREPRVRLAEAIAREGDALTLLITQGEARRSPLLRFDEISPARAAEIRAHGSRGPGFQRRLAALDSLPAVEKAFETLARDAATKAEAELHIGYLRIVQGDWNGAILHLSRIPGATEDPFVLHLGHYFHGWALARAERPAEAIEAYRRAVALMPGARIVSTLLAEQLFMSDQRDDAFALLERTFGSQPPSEPLIWFRRGGAREVELQFAMLREALR